MPKPKIFKRYNYWWYEYEDDGILMCQSYKYHAGAINGLQKYLRQLHMKYNGRLLIEHIIEEELLTIKEHEFYKKMKACNCNGITKYQYGYLKGIAERSKI